MVIRRKTFKVGQDVGVRIPKAWGIPLGTEFKAEWIGNSVVLTPLGAPPLTPEQRMAITLNSIRSSE